MAKSSETIVKALASLREYLSIDLTRTVRWISDPPSYSIWIGDQQIDLGGVEVLTSQTRFRKIIYQVTKKMPSRIHEKDWDGLLDIFGEAFEDEEVAITSEFEILQLWLSGYLEDRTPMDMAEGQTRWREQLLNQNPVMTFAGVYVNITSLQNYVIGRYHEPISYKEISTKMKRQGCDKETFQWKERGGVLRRHYWRLAKELTPEWALAMLPLEGSVDL